MEDTLLAPEDRCEIPEAAEEVLSPTPKETTAVTEVVVQNIPQKNKSKTPLFIGLAVAGVAVVVGIILLLIPSKEKQAISTANSYIEAENYQQAVSALSEVEQTDEVIALRDKIYGIVEDSVEELLDDEDYKGALKLLKQWEALPAYTELTDEALEGRVEELMNDGEYTDALTVLDDHKSVSNYEELYNKVKWESIILECAFNLRPSMKNPTSLQITSVEAYETSASDASYPAIILQSSGQNGFGGYSTSLVAFSTTDLSLLGSTSTMDSDDADDYTELLIIYLIEAYRESGDEITDLAFDLSRINSFLSSGKKPELNITEFKNENTSETNL